ncbi:MAG: ParB-like nuclease domain-containing protein [Anaerolineales bacterium]|nr:ParB-like nuclease domain-containing protein [Anaerolineales bacterium]
MNIYSYLTKARISPADKFHALKTIARREQIWARLTGKNTSLATLPKQAPHKCHRREFIGMKDIPVEQIVGTLESQSSFDHEFRPLKNSLQDKWVNAYRSLENGRWAPVLVHRIGNKYYVEDGHHRVSVARLLGKASIQAKIWEYPVHNTRSMHCLPAHSAERSSTKTCAIPGQN